MVCQKHSRHFLISALIIGFATYTPDLKADTPLGWINSDKISAYTTTKGEFEISGAIRAVNDTLDIFNYRDDLFAANRRLAGDSGDLDGTNLQVYYGITDYLSVFANAQEHELTVDLGTISSVNLIDIDSSLDTNRQEIGIKWMIYQGNLLAQNNRHSALTLQVSAFQSESDDFDVVVDEINLGSADIRFTNPQTFSVNELDDNGWQARLIYTTPVAGLGTASVWGGFGSSTASSGTDSDIVSESIAALFKQDFDLEEDYLYAGISLDFAPIPRLPISITYEYIDLRDSKFTRFPEEPSSALPSFLASTSTEPESGNHTLKAQVSYWITPRLHFSVTGNLYSNQFLGELPHYSNPLSESFSSVAYGFAGLKLGFKF